MYAAINRSRRRGLTTVEAALLIGLIACASIALWSNISLSAGHTAEAAENGFDRMEECAAPDGTGPPDGPAPRGSRPRRYWHH